MGRVKLSRVESALDDLAFPISRAEAADRFDDTTLTYADGESNLGHLIRDLPSDQFAGRDELVHELYTLLPTEALGEPGQSEGDA
jgi:hypothetical protein